MTTPGPAGGEGATVLCAGTLGSGVPFLSRVAAARAGGFDHLSLWGRDYEDARNEGLSDRDLRTILDDSGLSVAELDPAWWWLPGATAVHMAPEHDSERIFSFGEAELFAVADALGARSLNAVDVFGGPWSLDDAAESFAALCRRADEHGLLVQLEFLPWSKIPDLEAAWSVVREAGMTNGGLAVDAWHYFRSGSADGNTLRSVPGKRIVGVQLCDAPAGAESDLLQATLHERLLPGQGELDLTGLLADLRATGTTAPIGVEVFSDALADLAPEEIGRQAGAALHRLLVPTP
jgi:sugar phosphate isomerase/epimerase